MREEYLATYYEDYDEDGRLGKDLNGLVEFSTTMEYIHRYIKSKPAKILEVGTGTGRYSVALAKEGYDVTAIDVVQHNLNILVSKLDGTEKINVIQGNALDLSHLNDGEFDVTLLLGPMYHLFFEHEMEQALSEAIRVTKPSGYIMSAYCLNDASMIQYGFMLGNLPELLEKNQIDDSWHAVNLTPPTDMFHIVRTEEIAALDAKFDVKHIKLVATDGAARYIKDYAESWDEKTIQLFLSYHLATCERQDLIGATNHCLDILQKPYL